MPTENKITQAELENRVYIVGKMLAKGYARREIIKICTSPTSIKKNTDGTETNKGGYGWNLTPHGVDYYIGKCYEEMQKYLDIDKPKRAAQLIEIIEDSIVDAKKDRQHSSVSSLANVLVKIQGLETIMHEHKGNVILIEAPKKVEKSKEVKNEND